ncbi:hypothetical protein KVH30_02490 [Streptomyces olivaceus]|uniref:DUF7620 family protein n=1 Tax=Streptomyces olivaceus TaxID=47716 RepID=UPI001CCE92CF|nr:hypothetical protein [Streptomyces olivaceus]MBZ6290442.1 hypothetical protein [Streptomyces olivaceus]MBZ6324394.1 hypothetical protein [Streptomyces olivaceus]
MIAWLQRLLKAPDKPDLRASEAALARTRNDRQAAEDRQPIVDAAVAPLRRAREENHLRERIEALFRGAPS